MRADTEVAPLGVTTSAGDGSGLTARGGIAGSSKAGFATGAGPQVAIWSKARNMPIVLQWMA
eukprot:10728219-Prorocentrum_lima.AAC.1